MSERSPEVAAVRAALGTSDTPLRYDGGAVVEGGGGEWRVIPFPLPDPDPPELFIVGPLGGNDPTSLVHVAEVPGRGFTRLRGREPLEALLSAYPALSPKSIAVLVALALGESGGERVLVGDEVNDALDEWAADVPPPLRALEFLPGADGGWSLAFLTSRMHQVPPDRRWRHSVVRWRVRRDAAGTLSEQRKVVLDAVLLAQYA